MALHAPRTTTLAAMSEDNFSRKGRNQMERCNTLAAAYAARCKAGTRPAGAMREEGGADGRTDAPETPAVARAGLDEAVLLDVLRRSAGPCDRVFASRLAIVVGSQHVP
jgi:hypothetical protein